MRNLLLKVERAPLFADAAIFRAGEGITILLQEGDVARVTNRACREYPPPGFDLRHRFPSVENLARRQHALDRPLMRFRHEPKDDRLIAGVRRAEFLMAVDVTETGTVFPMGNRLLRKRRVSEHQKGGQQT